MKFGTNLSFNYAKGRPYYDIISDNGKGIAPEHLNRVFDPFFTTRLGQGGSGLGLNIVYNLSRGILGGQISVTSTRGIGTEFRLKLPWVAPHSEPGKDNLQAGTVLTTTESQNCQ